MGVCGIVTLVVKILVGQFALMTVYILARKLATAPAVIHVKVLVWKVVLTDVVRLAKTDVKVPAIEAVWTR